MTLALAAWCKNGVTLCADSRTSFPDSASGVLRTASNSTEKLFRIGRVGVVTAGYNEFVDRTINAHVQDFAAGYNAGPPSTVARDLVERFRELYNQHIAKYPQQRAKTDQGVIDFLVGGYEGDEPACFRARVVEQAAGTIAQFTTQRGAVTIKDGIGYWRLDGEYGFAWIGDGDVVECLVHGYHKSLLGSNAAWDVATRVVPIGMFSLQDCIDFLYFLSQASERMKHFSSGDGTKFGVNRTIGGPFDIAVVRRRTGFEFIMKKELRVNEQINGAPKIGSG